jgi:hypothetical protein
MRVPTSAMSIAMAVCGLCFHAANAGAQQASENAAPPSISSAPGAEVVQSEQYAALAFQAYVRKDYAEALLLYERAYKAAPNADIVLYNMARIYDVGLESRRLAIEHYRRYLAAPGATPDRISIARQRIAGLEAAERAAAAEFAATDTALAPSPLPSPAPAAASAVAAPAASAGAPLAVEANAWTFREIAALALGGIGAAGMGVGIGFGLSARAKRDIWQGACDGNVCTSQRGVDAAESAARQARIATAAFVAGSALVGLGATLWLVHFSTESPNDVALSLSPLVSDSEVGGAITGRF